MSDEEMGVNLSRWTRIKESVRGRFRGRALLLFGDAPLTGKVIPDPTFEDLNNILTGDPDIGSAVDFIADVVMGLGAETTMDSTYKETAKYKGEGDHQDDELTAKQIVDEKSEVFGLDQIIQEVTKDIVGYGNSCVWKGSGGVKLPVLMRIMPAAIKTFKFDDSGLRLRSLETKYKTFSANQLIWFNYNRIGKQAIGFGILQAVGTSLKFGGETREAFATIKARIQQAMTNQIETFSAPNQMWVLPDASDKALKKYHTEINKFEKGRRLAYNKKGATVVTAVPERMRGLDFYVETLWNSFYLALQTPLPKLFTSPGFSQASARAAMAMGERKIYALQRYIKRMVEREIFTPWIAEEGLDPRKANVRLHWRMIQRPDTNVLLPVLQQARRDRDLTQEEFRHILADMGLPIDPKQEVTEKPLQSSGEIIPRPKQPIETAEKKYVETPGGPTRGGE